MKFIASHKITFISYLRTIAFGSALLYLSVVLFNYLVDPYSIYGMPLHEGLNANKPELFKHLRLTKAHIIERVKPDALVIGSSRTEHGLNPEHPAMMKNLNSFNLALNGATIYENLRYFQHANAINSLKMVVLAVDFFQFNAYRPNTPDFAENRLEADIHGEKIELPKTTDVLSTLASVDATVASLKTIFQQENRTNVILDRGQVAQPDKDSIIMRSGGRHEAALYSELNYISHLYFPRPYKKFEFVSEDKKINTFDYFRRILEDAHRQKIRLYVLISPAHARQWILVNSTGLWDKWEEWKRELVRLNGEVARWFKSEPFPLWDFSGFNTYTTESVPDLGDRKLMMRWYWESSHYRVELGDMVLDRVLDYSDPERPIAEDFGVLINGENIDRHLAWIRKGREDYSRAHPDEVKEIDDLVRKYRRN
ncbi:MAG: hypothetical protein ACU833_12855 [Gammaproteobacteria bacterium]